MNDPGGTNARGPRAFNFSMVGRPNSPAAWASVAAGLTLLIVIGLISLVLLIPVLIVGAIAFAIALVVAKIRRGARAHSNEGRRNVKVIDRNESRISR